MERGLSSCATVEGNQRCLRFVVEQGYVNGFLMGNGRSPAQDGCHEGMTGRVGEETSVMIY